MAYNGTRTVFEFGTYLVFSFASSSLIGRAQNPSLVIKSGQAYLGRHVFKLFGSTLVIPNLRAPDQSESSGLPTTEMQ